MTSDDLNKIGAKIADCILPQHRAVALPHGLANAAAIYKLHMKNSFQIRYGEIPTDHQSPDYGQWQTPKQTLRPRSVFIVSDRKNEDTPPGETAKDGAATTLATMNVMFDVKPRKQMLRPHGERHDARTTSVSVLSSHVPIT